MFKLQTRRQFLNRTTLGATTASLGSLTALLPFSPATANDALITPDMVRFDATLEPLVRLMEVTPRDQCVPVFIEQLRRGLSYKHFLSALYLAALRRSKAHHTVFRVHAVHRMSMDARPEDRLLPLFWALDGLKRRLDKYPTPPVKPIEGKLPTGEAALREFDDALRTFDVERSERAVVALVRAKGGRQVMERLWHYISRDWGDEGHKGIAVANCYRTLEAIGWQHAELTLRFVVGKLALESKRSFQTFQLNQERARSTIGKLALDWTRPAGDESSTLEIWQIIRGGEHEPACELAFHQLKSGVPAGAIWDAVHLAGAEHMVRDHSGGVGGYPLHSNTSANALHYAFRTCNIEETRLVILLQAVAWMSALTRVTITREGLRDIKITEMPMTDIPTTQQEAVDEIFTVLSTERKLPTGNERSKEPSDRKGRDAATPRAFAFAQHYPDSNLFFDTARRLVFLKASFNAHNFKFPAAIFEDYHLVSPQWRPHMLAASVHFLYGSESQDSPVIRQAREILSTG